MENAMKCNVNSVSYTSWQAAWHIGLMGHTIIECSYMQPMIHGTYKTYGAYNHTII